MARLCTFSKRQRRVFYLNILRVWEFLITRHVQKREMLAFKSIFEAKFEIGHQAQRREVVLLFIFYVCFWFIYLFIYYYIWLIAKPRELTASPLPPPLIRAHVLWISLLSCAMSIYLVGAQQQRVGGGGGKASRGAKCATAAKARQKLKSACGFRLSVLCCCQIILPHLLCSRQPGLFLLSEIPFMSVPKNVASDSTWNNLCIHI